MIKVNLHGELGFAFGQEWSLDAKTIQEAFHAININTRGKFLEFLKERPYALAVNHKMVTDKDEIQSLLIGPFSNVQLDLVPELSGRIDWATLIYYIIAAVVTAAISYALTPSPETDAGSSDIKKDSYLFNSGPRTAEQGNPVPLGYGTMMVYPIVVSAEYDYSKVASGGTGNNGRPAVCDEHYATWLRVRGAMRQPKLKNDFCEWMRRMRSGDASACGC